MKCSKCSHNIDDKSLICPVCGNYNFFEFNSEKKSLNNKSTDKKVIEPVLEEKITEKVFKNYTPAELMQEIKELMEKTLDKTAELNTSSNLESSEETPEKPLNEEKDNSSVNLEEPIDEINQSIDNITVKPEINSNNELKGTGFFENYLDEKIDKKRNDNLEKKSYFSYKILMTILFITIIVIGIITIYISYMSPKAIYKKVQNQLYSFVATNFNQNISTMSGNLNGYFIISNNMKNNPINWQFDTEYGIDYQKRTANITFKTNQNYKELSNVNYYLKDGYSYINVGDKFNQYVSQPYENFNRTISLKDDIATINEAIDIAFKRSIKNKYITESKSTIKEEYQEETNIDVLILNYNDFIEEFLLELKKNQDFINTYSKLKNVGPNEIENLIQAEINRNRNITFKLYTKGLLKKVIGLKISFKDKNNYSLEIIKKSDERYVFTYKSSSLKQPLNGEIILNKMSEWLDLKLEANDQKNIEVLANISLKNTYNEVVKQTNITNSIKQIELPDDKLLIYKNELENNKAIFNYNYNKQLLN